MNVLRLQEGDGSKPVTDQWLPPFVIVGDDDKPVGTIEVFSPSDDITDLQGGSFSRMLHPRSQGCCSRLKIVADERLPTSCSVPGMTKLVSFMGCSLIFFYFISNTF